MSFLIAVIMLSLLIFVNALFTQMPLIAPAGIFLLPVAGIIVCVLLNNKTTGLRNKIFALKYSKRFPLFFYNSSKSVSCLEDMDKLKSILKEGDILLRRHKNHIDGLILGQTSYFTHAAIYYGAASIKDATSGEQVTRQHQVLHAVGNAGVCYESIEDFCSCEHIAVMRFAPSAKQILYTLRKTKIPISFLDDRKQQMGNLKAVRITNSKHVGVWANEAIAGDVLSFIQISDSNKSVAAVDSSHHFVEDEFAVYTKLINNIIEQKIIYEPDYQTYLPLIKQQAELKVGAPYDFNFNFVDFKTLSCVEYVWYCYKCLFPLHQIKRKQFTYFNWVKAFVLVPDMFLANSFFNLEFTTVHAHTDQNSLKRYARSHLVVFWKYLLTVIIWEVAILFIISILYHLVVKGKSF